MASLLEDLRARHDGQTVVYRSATLANLWALEHLLGGAPLQELVDAPFVWQEGWPFRLDTHDGGQVLRSHIPAEIGRSVSSDLFDCKT
jgi:hypothetical protein